MKQSLFLYSCIYYLLYGCFRGGLCWFCLGATAGRGWLT